MARDPLDRAATLERLSSIAAAGGLSDAALVRAIEVASESPPALQWRAFVSRALLFVGAALMLSGVIFFFAFNWADLPHLAKLGLVQLAVAGAAIAAWQLGRTVGGEVALAAAAVLVGPLLAVYGQAYQTGADAYELFVGWAVLILPWVLTARAPALWLVELALWNVGLGLFWDQRLQPSGPDKEWLWAALALLNGTAWLAGEWWQRRSGSTRAARWPLRVPALAAFGTAMPMSLAMVFEAHDLDARWVSAALLAGFAGAAYWLSRRPERRDLFLLAAAGASVLTFVGCVAGQVVFYVLKLDELGLLLLGVFVIGEVGGLVMWLRRMGSAEVGEA